MGKKGVRMMGHEDRLRQLVATPALTWSIPFVYSLLGLSKAKSHTGKEGMWSGGGE